MKIYLDCEGCIYSMLDAIKIRNPAFKPSGVVRYDFKDCDMGIERSEVLSYLSDVDTFKLEPLYKGAAEGVKQLMQFGKVVGYSTVPEHVADFRRWQFRKVGIRDVILFNPAKEYADGKDKKKIEDANVIIDDCPDVLKMYDSNKVIKIMVTQPYNKMYMDAYHVKNLIEAAQLIRKMK